MVTRSKTGVYDKTKHNSISLVSVMEVPQICNTLSHASSSNLMPKEKNQNKKTETLYIRNRGHQMKLPDGRVKPRKQSHTEVTGLGNSLPWVLQKLTLKRSQWAIMQINNKKKIPFSYFVSRGSPTIRLGPEVGHGALPLCTGDNTIQEGCNCC